MKRPNGAQRRRTARGVTAAMVAAALSVAATSSAGGAPASPPSSTVWLCRPGLAHNPCTGSLASTVVHPDGTRTVQRAAPAGHPRVDCFYVYPTVSAQPTTNADLTIDPEETAVAQAQAARFSQVCQVYAPMYRQLTLDAIGGGGAGAGSGAMIAYQSMLAAWQDYLAHDNHGRGVVFIGHSQGAALLIALLRNVIDPNPTLRRLVVSAVLLGGNVTVPVGQDVGGDFQHLPACRRATQTGCIIAYSSFDHAPPTDSLFGRVGQGVSSLSGNGAASATQVLCTNPAALAGGTGPLQPYFPTRAFPGPIGPETNLGTNLPTAFVSYPQLYTASCENAGGASWLQINDIGTTTDPRPRVADTIGPTWGLHLADVNIALGNLVSVVGRQAAAYRP